MTDTDSSAGGSPVSGSFVAIKDITVHDSFQVRFKLHRPTITRYVQMYLQETGCPLPPLKVAKVGNALILVDGWHRLEALRHFGATRAEVEIVPCKTESEAAWLAAAANLTHGKPLTNKEIRRVFRRYIRTRQHIGKGGRYKSYRVMAAEIGGSKHFTTIRDWMWKDFPRIAEKMTNLRDKKPKGQENAESMGVVLMIRMATDHLENAMAAFRGIADPDERGEVVTLAEKLIQEMKQEEIAMPEVVDIYGNECDF